MGVRPRSKNVLFASSGPQIPFTWANAHWSLWFEHIPDSTVLSIPVKLCCFWPAFYSYKKTKTYYILRTIIECNNIFDTNILSRGYPTKLKIYTNSRGVVDYEKRPLQCIMKIPGGVAGYDKQPLQCIMEIPGVGGAYDINVRFKGGMDIF